MVISTDIYSNKILVLHGPNLNLLGQRETNIYGEQTLEQLNFKLNAQAKECGATLFDFQSNYEGALVDRVHQAKLEKINFILLNPAGFTSTSVALRDALLAISVPFIEIHISNIYKREFWRKHSYFSDCALGVISGLGWEGYTLALNFALNYLTKAVSISN